MHSLVISCIGRGSLEKGVKKLQKYFFGAFLGFCSAIASAQPTDIILMRHLHKGSGDNPSLSPCGLAQAKEIKQLLATLNMQQAWHSQYRRTEQTARLLTTASTLLQPYDAKITAPAFKNTLLAQSGVQLVVGHSNTIPSLVEALSGDKISIDERDYGVIFHLRWQQDHWQLTQQALANQPTICTLPNQPQQH